jgi:hypothetical protein
MARHPQVHGRTCSITLNAFSRAAVMGDADAIYEEDCSDQTAGMLQIS